MAICTDCQREMTEAATCTVQAIRIGEAVYRRFRWSPGRGWRAQRCGDCGVRPGGWHHLGCDVERCPACRGQLICCECTAEDGDGFASELAPVLPRPTP